MSPVIVTKSGLHLVDELEAAFAACDHPHARAVKAPWCNVCGACTVADGVWVKPHWRDILAAAVDRFFR